MALNQRILWFATEAQYNSYVTANNLKSDQRQIIFINDSAKMIIKGTTYTGNSLPTTGGTMTGDITFRDDGEGIIFYNGNGGKVYKRVGGGLTLRMDNANADPVVETFDGVNRYTILHQNNFNTWAAKKAGDTGQDFGVRNLTAGSVLISGFTEGADVNNIVNTRFGTGYITSAAVNMPSSLNWNISVLGKFQIAVGDYSIGTEANTANVYLRSLQYDGWSTWKKLWNDKNANLSTVNWNAKDIFAYSLNSLTTRSDGGRGLVEFWDSGFGYAYSAKYLTFKANGEAYGMTNDYGTDGAQLSLVANQGSTTSGGNIGLYTGKGSDGKARLGFRLNANLISQFYGDIAAYGGLSVSGNITTGGNAVIHAGNIGSQAVKTANQLQAFTGDDFTGGNHYIKAIRSTSGWGMRLHTCYDGGAATTNDVSVKYADGAGNADTVDGLHIANLALRRSDIYNNADSNPANIPWFTDNINRVHVPGVEYSSVLSMLDGGSTVSQLRINYSNKAFIRSSQIGTNWVELITTSNIGSQSVSYASNSSTTSQRNFAEGLVLGCGQSTGRGAYGMDTVNLILAASNSTGTAKAGIDFRSGYNYPSDGAQIYYESDINGSSAGEISRLVIRNENDANDTILIRAGQIVLNGKTVDGGGTNPPIVFQMNDNTLAYIDSEGKYSGKIDWSNVNSKPSSLSTGDAGALRISTGTGYADIGSQNDSWFHFQTNRPSFYMNRSLAVDGEIRVYNSNTYLNSGSGYIAGNTIVHSGNVASYTNKWYDGWVNVPGYDANTIGASKSGFSYSNNCPNTGCLVHFDAGGYGLQLSSLYHSGGGSIGFRTRNGDNNTWNSWYNIIHSGNIGSQSVNYASSAGNADISAVISVTDSRNVVTTPQTINRAVVFDFKANETEGLSDGGSFFGEMTFRQYGDGTDWTGGKSHQLGFTDNNNIWHRAGSWGSWGSWKKLIDSGNIGSQSVNYASSAGNANTLNNKSLTQIQQDDCLINYILINSSNRYKMYAEYKEFNRYLFYSTSSYTAELPDSIFPGSFASTVGTTLVIKLSPTSGGSVTFYPPPGYALYDSNGDNYGSIKLNKGDTVEILMYRFNMNAVVYQTLTKWT